MSGNQVGKGASAAIELCVHCPRLCHFACPVAHGDASETATAWGMMSLAHFILRGDIEPTAADVENLHRCVSCERCTAFCRHENPVASTLAEVRALDSVRALAPPAVHELQRSYVSCGGPAAPAESVHAEVFGREGGDEDAAIAYFPSCAHGQGGGVGPTRIRDAMEKVAGERVRIAWRENATCCGGVAARAGLASTASNARSAALDALAGSRIRVSDCADLCEESDGEVTPLVTFLAQHRQRLRALAGNTNRGRITLHGGCRERRVAALAQEERAVLEAIGWEVDEAFAINGEQECCAADPVYRSITPDGARRAAASVVAGARRTPGALVTSAVRCSAHMSECSGESVASVIELLVVALEEA